MEGSPSSFKLGDLPKGIKRSRAKDQEATIEGSENKTEAVDVQMRLASDEFQRIWLARVSCTPGYRSTFPKTLTVGKVLIGTRVA